MTLLWMLRRMHPNREGGEIAELDANEDVTLVDVDTAVEMDADIQGRMERMLLLLRKLMLLSLQSLMTKRPIFEREYNKIQTFLKSDRDEEPTKKRVTKETLIQESFKKLRAEVKVSGSSSTQQDTPTIDPAKIFEEDDQNMVQIIPVAEFKAEALQVKYLLID
uniref:Uncharacterized protein n=1 Tax=Tanacetum cinerariifolium TaxID=118510 RepID=A0A6L2LWU6_TANCI|nr:hypothetical protein [Tanacetum cinerariifolium]